MSKKYPAMHVYCPPSTREKLAVLAKENFRSLSAEVQALIEQAWEARKVKKETR